MEQSFLGSSEGATAPVSENDRLLSILAHVLTFFFGFLAPLIIYLIKKDESAYVREHARESLNFQLTLWIGYIIGIILTLVIIGILLLVALGIVHLVLVIVATVKAADNKLYRYPLSFRFIR